MSKKYLNLLVIISVTVASTVVMWLLVGTKAIQENFDGPYYGVVAQSWYDREIISKNFSFPLPLEYYPAHLPLYPLLMLVGGMITGSVLSGGVVVTLFMSILGVVCVYLIWEKNKWPYPVWSALIWLFIWPRMWAVRTIASPETLFIVLILVSLYAFDKRKYWIAGIAGGLAVLTKTPGLLLFVAYGLWWAENYLRTKKMNWQIWPVILIPGAFLALCGYYQIQIGDFWAYFNTGDNIHLQALPFRIFDSNQIWVGSFWLEDILWIYLIGGLGIYRAYRKNKVWGWFGIVYLVAIAFVTHRDIARYSLPIVPIVVLGLGELFERKEFRIALLVCLIPLGLFTLNFLVHNRVEIPSLAPFAVYSLSK